MPLQRFGGEAGGEAGCGAAPCALLSVSAASHARVPSFAPFAWSLLASAHGSVEASGGSHANGVTLAPGGGGGGHSAVLACSGAVAGCVPTLAFSARLGLSCLHFSLPTAAQALTCGASSTRIVMAVLFERCDTRLCLVVCAAFMAHSFSSSFSVLSSREMAFSRISFKYEGYPSTAFSKSSKVMKKRMQSISARAVAVRR
mmetsp:Transcript_41048/g.94148  ORF Transcript_41048/g.94148 Transcript_41048/m.94148 type:complete len:201 (-) Transcript_41048:686-1288(-)